MRLLADARALALAGLVGACMAIAASPAVAASPGTASISAAGDDQNAAQQLAGTWQGTYTCAQGVTGLTLVVKHESAAQLSAIFEFYEVPQNPGVPTGSFNMTGSVSEGTLTLQAGEWIEQPSGYLTVGMTGSVPVQPDGSVGPLLQGQIVEHPGSCTTFELGRGVPGLVQILSGPEKTTAEQSAVFTFKGTPGGSYECSVDNGPWTACVSGQPFGSLAPGDHLFQVRQLLNGLIGPPAAYNWTIELPRKCVLRVARARVFVFARQRRVRLVIRYKSYRPADVSVSYTLVGRKGRSTLGRASSHFKLAGIFRLPATLDRRRIRKVRRARLMKVRFKIPKTPRGCGRYYTKRLTIPRKISGQTVWFQSDSIFAPG